MDFFPADRISEVEITDAAFTGKWELDCTVDALVDNLDMNLFSPSSYYNTDPTSRSTQIISAPNYNASETCIYIPDQQLKNKDFSNFYSQKRCTQKGYFSSSSSASIIAFGDASANKIVKSEPDAVSLGEMSFQEPIFPNSIHKLYTALEYDGPVKRSITRTTLQAQDHVFAERKRRQKLSRLFVSLSTMIPGLKKLDKASILGGTIELIKQLEQRLETLEKEQKKRGIEESVVSAAYVKRPRVSSYYDTSSLNYGNFEGSLNQSILPEIEVRTSDGNILLGVYCQKRTGIIKEVLCEVENLGLCIINSSAIPFGDTTLHVSVIAQMKGNFCLPDEGLAENVKRAILKLL